MLNLGPNMDSIPQTEEQFRLWMVEKVGEIQTSQQTIVGDLKTAIAHHDALKDQVDDMKADAKSAKNWENGKFLVTYAIQGLAMLLFGRHHGV
jgi:hypothetical protein